MKELKVTKYEFYDSSMCEYCDRKAEWYFENENNWNINICNVHHSITRLIKDVLRTTNADKE
jgi:hypothetical protein